MLIVTLTTDWKDGDYNIGRLKACIISCCEDVRIIDIIHNIEPFNTLQAAFILKNTYKDFPSGSIHFIGVNSEPSPKNKIAVMKSNEHFFVGTNDGMLSLICDKQPDLIVELSYGKNNSTFHAPELLSNCVKAILEGVELEKLGNACKLEQAITGSAACSEANIRGRMIYIDSFGNAITNIDIKTFEKICKNRKFEILVQNNLIKITKLSQYYDDVDPGKILALFNSFGLLELTMNQGNISRLNKLNTESSVIIRFLDN
jgi:S-adenosylmethionine hydrolase